MRTIMLALAAASLATPTLAQQRGDRITASPTLPAQATSADARDAMLAADEQLVRGS